MRKPRPLRPGDRIHFVSPASPPDPYKLHRGAQRFRDLGFEVTYGPLIRNLRARGYLAGSDEERAEDLANAFEDPDVDAIVCATGGYGALRLLPSLDFDAIAANPKVFVGFSDITVLHIAFNQRAKLVTFHGPMGSLEADDHFDAYTRKQFMRAVTTTEALDEVPPPPDGRLVQTVNPGRARGVLAGGNLSLVCATLGTPYEIDTRGKILILEDWREPAFTVDTYLTQLKLAGKFEEAAGVVFGEFVKVVPDDEPQNHSVDEVVQEVMGDIGRPVLYGLAAGHGRHLATLPLGVRAEIDGDEGILRILEPACADTVPVDVAEAGAEATARADGVTTRAWTRKGTPRKTF